MSSLNELGLDSKYVVIKHKDISELSNDDRLTLKNILNKIGRNRRSRGEKHNDYIVVNTDEPYACEVANLVKSNI